MSHVGGAVLSIDDVSATDAAFSGVTVVVAAEDGAIAVNLGPKRFLEEHQLSIVPGDTVEVTGIPTRYQGRPAMFGMAVGKGGRELRLPERPMPAEPDSGASH